MDKVLHKIHLIEKLNYIKFLNDHEWESGWWAIPEQTAKALIGGLIFFHEEQKKPSHFGGKILDYRIETDGEYEGRILFRFESLQECKNVKTSSDGWSFEKKIIWGN